MMRLLLAPGVKAKISVILLFLLAVFLGACADEAFLPPPENLPYAQEHEQDGEAPATPSVLNSF